VILELRSMDGEQHGTPQGRRRDGRDQEALLLEDLVPVENRPGAAEHEAPAQLGSQSGGLTPKPQAPTRPPQEVAHDHVEASQDDGLQSFGGRGGGRDDAPPLLEIRAPVLARVAVSFHQQDRERRHAHLHFQPARVVGDEFLGSAGDSAVLKLHKPHTPHYHGRGQAATQGRDYDLRAVPV